MLDFFFADRTHSTFIRMDHFFLLLSWCACVCVCLCVRGEIDVCMCVCTRSHLQSINYISKWMHSALDSLTVGRKISANAKLQMYYRCVAAVFWVFFFWFIHQRLFIIREMYATWTINKNGSKSSFRSVLQYDEWRCAVIQYINLSCEIISLCVLIISCLSLSLSIYLVLSILLLLLLRNFFFMWPDNFLMWPDVLQKYFMHITLFALSIHALYFVGILMCIELSTWTNMVLPMYHKRGWHQNLYIWTHTLTRREMQRQHFKVTIIIYDYINHSPL